MPHLQGEVGFRLRRKAGGVERQRPTNKAFPLRGRWRGEAVTDEVATREPQKTANPSVGLSAAGSPCRGAVQPPPARPAPSDEGAVSEADWGREHAI